ncbi:butyrophilin subfamily 3 member A3-like isoform X2 [Pelodiscus sinensis]|uniref:butyrophilin subfamily 3 member A3-like isoform X2 n=1 Tax=Pelodiscus sinensis TaxID=13735 RepID=UPI003F6B31BB
MDSLFQWTRAMLILTFLKTPCLIRGEYRIVPHESSVIGFIGEDVILPCQMIAANIPEDINVQWRLVTPQENRDVSSYNRANKEEKQDVRYQGRTEFFHHGMSTGNMSLKLKNVQSSDSGNYVCRVVSENWYDETEMEMQVTARGGESSIFLEHYTGQGINLACRTEGWFPEPQVLWLASEGENRTEKMTTIYRKTPAGTYNIESSIHIEPGSNNEVSCKIINNVLNTSSESRVLISDAFFPTTSPWMTVFLIILFLSIAIIMAVGYKLKKNNDTTSHSEKERLLNALETNKRIDAIAIQDIQENIGQLLAELDFRRAQSYAVSITLDPGCKHPELRLSEDQRRVWHEAESPEPAAASRALLVVGREGFAAGRQYWEVEVGYKVDWELGVLSQAVRETVKREKPATLPGEGCWSLRRSQGDLFSSPENKKIKKYDAPYAVIGVFLDQEEGRITFYEAGVMLYIVTIPAELSEKCLYYPFLSAGNSTGEQRPLTILPVRLPVPLQPLRKEK